MFALPTQFELRRQTVNLSLAQVQFLSSVSTIHYVCVRVGAGGGGGVDWCHLNQQTVHFRTIIPSRVRLVAILIQAIFLLDQIKIIS